MNKTTILLFFTLSAQLHGYTIMDFIDASIGTNNEELFVQLSSTLSPAELNAREFKSNLKVFNLTPEAFAQKLNARRKTPSENMTHQQALELLSQAKINIPPISSKAEAKQQLVNYFEPTAPGGQLLAEIGAQPNDIANVRAALQQVHVAPAA